MSNKPQSSKSFSSMLAGIVIPVALVFSYIIYKFVLGSASNFEGGDPNNNPLPGNIMGIVYKGGMIVPVLMTLLFLVITFSVERYIIISRARGKSSLDGFMMNVRAMLHSRDIDGCINACNTQEGSVANVIHATLSKYKQMETETGMERDQKILAITEEGEEAMTLELPALEKNLVFLSTIASIATLMGLLGTVLGMIRAFAALAQAGSPDSVALATGISEALINTALGISTSAIAIILYNVFTTKIDKLTYSMDEAGYSIAQTFAATHDRDGKQIK